MKSNYKQLGKYIESFDFRNKNSSEPLGLDAIKGISSIHKSFIKTKANLVGVSPGNYKVVKPNQFGFNPNTARMGDKIPIALNSGENDVLVSSIYPTFKIIDENELLPEYLMMWFKRPEFDRYARFKSHGSAREVFGFDEMCDVELPVPYIEKQREIVKEYNTTVSRIKLNEQLNQKLEETAQALFKHWFVDFEFPDENGQPYKSSGGEMVYNEELDKEIPEGWNIKNFSELSIIRAGGDKPKSFSSSKTEEFSIPIFSNSTFNQGLFGFTNQAKVIKKSITVSARGGIGFTALRTEPYVPIVRLIVVIPKREELLNYLYLFLSNFDYDDVASAQAQLTIPDVSTFKILVPKDDLLKGFQILGESIYNRMEINRVENKCLLKISSILLSKISKVESPKMEQVI
jgi:type I restriction enzyme S subunit